MTRLLSILAVFLAVFLAGFQFGGRGLFVAVVVIGLLLGEQMREGQ